MSWFKILIFLFRGVSVLVVHADNQSLTVELQVDLVTQFDVISVTLLVYLSYLRAWETIVYILLDCLGNDGFRHFAHSFAVNLVPCAVLFELYLCSVVEEALIFVPVFLGIENFFPTKLVCTNIFACAGSNSTGIGLSSANATFENTMHISAERKNLILFIINIFLIRLFCLFLMQSYYQMQDSQNYFTISCQKAYDNRACLRQKQQEAPNFVAKGIFSAR